MFSIAFSPGSVEYIQGDPTIPCLRGRIVLGDAHPEGFCATLSSWSTADYEAQWLRELRALIEGGEKASLIVDYTSRPIETWNAYKEGSIVHFQNQLVDFVPLPNDLKLEELSSHLGERFVFTEEGARISEWDVDMQSIEAFVLGNVVGDTIRS